MILLPNVDFLPPPLLWFFVCLIYSRYAAYWVVPENIHTHTTGGVSEFQRGGGYINWNSEDMGGGGAHWTGILKAWGDFQESNFQFGVVKSLKGKIIKNDLSKDDDSLVNTGHIQFNQHAGCTFQWSWSI